MINLLQAMEMVEELKSDNMMGITNLDGYGEDVAVLIYDECLRLQSELTRKNEQIKRLKKFVKDIANG